MTATDVISVVVRALSFIALFQAAGIAISIAMFGRLLEQSSQRIREVGFISALAGLAFVAVHYSLEAARMAGSLAGIFDWSLQQLVLASSMSAAAGARLAGLLLIAITIRREGVAPILLGLAGAVSAVVGFTFVGHTANAEQGAWLPLLLIFHLLVVAFWFGGLAPLHIASRLEHRQRSAQIVAKFSWVASLVVPGLFLLGVALTLVLVDRWSVFAETYGLLLIAKASGFALLMALAAMNKWRYGPALASTSGAVAAFQRTVAAEYVLICLVLIATAVMTTFFSPSH
jgi:putative copper export protein